MCPFCVQHEESAGHLLLLCKFAWSIWTHMLRWWEMSWVCPPTLYELICWWFCNNFKNVEKGCWEICFYAILWSTWLERNHIIFKQKTVDLDKIVEEIKTKVAIWTKAKFDLKNYSVEDIKRCLQGIRKQKVGRSQSCNGISVKT